MSEASEKKTYRVSLDLEEDVYKNLEKLLRIDKSKPIKTINSLLRKALLQELITSNPKKTKRFEYPVWVQNQGDWLVFSGPDLKVAYSLADGFNDPETLGKSLLKTDDMNAMAKKNIALKGKKTPRPGKVKQTLTGKGEFLKTSTVAKLFGTYNKDIIRRAHKGEFRYILEDGGHYKFYTSDFIDIDKK